MNDPDNVSVRDLGFGMGRTGYLVLGTPTPEPRNRHVRLRDEHDLDEVRSTSVRQASQLLDELDAPDVLHRTLRILGKGSKPAVIPLVPRTARTVDLAIGERWEGPILRRHDCQRLDRRTAHRWVKAIGKQAGLGHVHPHMLRGAFIMAALDAGVPLRDVQLAARHADPRTTTIYDRRRENFDRHAAYVVVAFVAGA